MVFELIADYLVRECNLYNCYLVLFKLVGRLFLTCVYIDVNGLHELNNTHGHEEGDKMLRTVACILREIFGEEDSYRIGGDEFVAFALDSPDTELNENIERFVRQVEEAGYSVAVGTASHSAGGIDIDALVKKAEQRMYLDKSRHYEQLRRGTEE